MLHVWHRMATPIFLCTISMAASGTVEYIWKYCLNRQYVGLFLCTSSEKKPPSISSFQTVTHTAKDVTVKCMFIHQSCWALKHKCIIYAAYYSFYIAVVCQHDVENTLIKDPRDCRLFKSSPINTEVNNFSLFFPVHSFSCLDVTKVSGTICCICTKAFWGSRHKL